MKFSKAIDTTLRSFNITAKEISLKSGVAESSISRYRRGERDIQADSLERMIEALPPQAQQFFYFNCLVTNIDSEGIAILLNAIALKISSTDTSSSHSQETPSSGSLPLLISG